MGEDETTPFHCEQYNANIEEAVIPEFTSDTGPQKPQQEPCDNCVKLKKQIKCLRSAFGKSKKRNQMKQEKIMLLTSQLKEYEKVCNVWTFLGYVWP